MRKKFIFKAAIIVSCVGLLFSLSYCFGFGSSFSFNTKWTLGKTTPKPTKPIVKKVTVNHPKVQFLMKNGEIMVFELYPEYAPATVENFIKLSKAKFYDGLKFHRIIKGFMIQGGDPKGDGTGGAEKTIKGEFLNNGFKKNTLKHTKGVISMARSSESNDSASSQFFIVDGGAPHLNGDYAAFGKLISGSKTLDNIASTSVDYNEYGEKSLPIKDIIIKRVIVLSDGKSK